MHPIIRLVNRNLTISVAGFAYAPLINAVPFGNKDLDYPAFLASGMIGFNIMNSTLISGIIIWNDRKHGMFEQIMSGPFTRSHYILSNICTIGIIGLVSATLIAVVGYPVFFESVEFSLVTIPIIIFGAITGSVLFGSLASIISTRLRSSEGFNVIINTVFLFFAFVSTAFYPAGGAPEPLRTAFYLNPLTYLVDVIRAGIFGTVNEFVVIIEMIILVGIASTLFVIASKLLTKLDF
jgi:ABC-2 type transport system permease protein